MLISMRFSWSSCQPVLLHVAMTSTCWKFQTHIFYLAVLLSQLQRLFTEFQIFYNCNGEAMCYSFLQVIWTTSGANHGPPGKHLLAIFKCWLCLNFIDYMVSVGFVL